MLNIWSRETGELETWDSDKIQTCLDNYNDLIEALEKVNDKIAREILNGGYAVGARYADHDHHSFTFRSYWRGEFSAQYQIPERAFIDTDEFILERKAELLKKKIEALEERRELDKKRIVNLRKEADALERKLTQG